MRSISRRDIRQRGSTSVEFALVAMPFILLTFGAIEGGRLLYALTALTYAVASGARVAALPATSGTGTVVQAVVNDALPLNVSSGNVTVTVNQGVKSFANRSAGDSVEVVATYTYQPAASFVFPNVALSADHVMVCE
jgi:Flp pilus assembly protein TadG